MSRARPTPSIWSTVGDLSRKLATLEREKSDPVVPQNYGAVAWLHGATGAGQSVAATTVAPTSWLHVSADNFGISLLTYTLGTTTPTNNSARTNTTGDVAIRVVGYGWCLLDGWAQWPNGAYERAVRWRSGSDATFYNQPNAMNSANSSVTLPTLGDQFLRDSALVFVAGNDNFVLELENYSAGSKSVANIQARVTFLPEPGWTGLASTAQY